VRIERVSAPGAAILLGNSAAALSTAPAPTSCAPTLLTGVPVTPGDRAQLLPDGLAAAPAGAPQAVAEIIAAGNQIAGKPYVYGAGHGAALSVIAPAYDCSSSVEHLLYGARLVPVTDASASSTLESFGQPGPGRWVTLYASPSHVFMYVAGLRWDTHDAAGPGDGSPGLGWHPLIRSADGFVARHPEGL
jgi:cell wall-associated NlpC family hydrolase